MNNYAHNLSQNNTAKMAAAAAAWLFRERDY